VDNRPAAPMQPATRDRTSRDRRDCDQDREPSARRLARRRWADDAAALDFDTSKGNSPEDRELPAAASTAVTTAFASAGAAASASAGVRHWPPWDLPGVHSSERRTTAPFRAHRAHSLPEWRARA
jgi:hypothetical protein